MTREQAKEILNGMSLEDCIKMFNDKVTAGFFFRSTIHEIDDDRWWNALFGHRHASSLAIELLVSAEESKFDRADNYFFYNEDDYVFYSFSIKEDLVEITGEDFFIDEIENRA